MATFEELARHAQGVTAVYPPLPLVVQWASRRVHELVGKRRTAIFRRRLELSIPAAVTAGAVTISRGSRTLTGDATAQAAWAALPATFPDGWLVRPKAAWYKVAGKTATALTLLSDYAEDDVAATSYSLVEQYHKTPGVVQYDEFSFVLARIGLPLGFLSMSEMDAYFPQRWGLFMGGLALPGYVAEAEPAIDYTKQVELYPYPSQSELITFSGWVEPPPFVYQDLLPFALDLYHILPGLEADLYTWHAMQETTPEAARQQDMNEAARCLTRWEASKEQALIHIQGNRIQSFVLMKPGSKAQRPMHGIRTAYDEVWSRQ